MRAKAGPAISLLAALLAAGCLAPITDRLQGELGAPPASGLVAPVPVSLTAPGAEPVVAAARDGTLYVEGVGATRTATGGTTNVNKVWRSTDDGATWTDITPPFNGQERSNDGFVAVADDGRVYAANVFSLTFQLFASNDKGATWSQLRVPPVPMLMHRHWIVPQGESTVQLVFEALPPSYGPYLAGQSPPADAPATPNEGLWYTRSEDKGASWSQPRQIDPVVNFAGQGNLVVSKNGTRLVVLRYQEPDSPRFAPSYEKGQWYALVSEDGGDSWERREAMQLTSELATAVPSVAIDPAGTVYAVWSQLYNGSSRLHYSFTTDAVSWATPRVLPVGNGTHAMPWWDAKANGTLALMWYAADVEGAASEVNASWHVEYALIEGADTDTPTATVTRATTEPVHEGNICAKGPACGAGEDRRLLDYPWLDVGPDRRAHAVFASTKWERPSAFAVYFGERRS